MEEHQVQQGAISGMDLRHGGVSVEPLRSASLAAALADQDQDGVIRKRRTLRRFRERRLIGWRRQGKRRRGSSSEQASGSPRGFWRALLVDADLHDVDCDSTIRVRNHLDHIDISPQQVV